MTSRDFCYWLQGHFELNGSGPIDAAKADLIRRHLALVFKHEIDPSMGDAEHQAELNAIHSPPAAKSPESCCGSHEAHEAWFEAHFGPKDGDKAEPKTVHVHHHHKEPLIRC